MTCHYLEEDGYQKICRAKGIIAPTFTELRQYCFYNAYICPVYQRYIQKVGSQLDDQQKNAIQQHLDLENDKRLDDLI